MYDQLYLKVFAGDASEFTLYEDDGKSQQLLNGKFAATKISQHSENDETDIVIDAASGTFDGFPATKTLTIELINSGAQAVEVKLNGGVIPDCGTASENPPCFRSNPGEKVVVFAGQATLSQQHRIHVAFQPFSRKDGWAHFVCRDGVTTSGTSTYIIGDDSALGSWDPARAVLLHNDAYPLWTGTVKGLQVGKSYQWKCIKRQEQSADVVQWEGGENHVFQGQQGFSGSQIGTFSN